MYCSYKYTELKGCRVLCVKILQLCPIVFCGFRAVLQFYFGLLTNDKPNKLRQVERRQCSDKDSCFFLMNYMPPPHRREECKGTLSKLCGSVAFCFYHQSKHNILNIVHTSATCFGHHQVDVTMKWTGSIPRRPPPHYTLRSRHCNIYLVMAETCCSRCMHNVQYALFAPIKNRY
jgi:hypothetical protein